MVSYQLQIYSNALKVTVKEIKAKNSNPQLYDSDLTNKAGAPEGKSDRLFFIPINTLQISKSNNKGEIDGEGKSDKSSRVPANGCPLPPNAF